MTYIDIMFLIATIGFLVCLLVGMLYPFIWNDNTITRGSLQVRCKECGCDDTAECGHHD